MLYLGSKENNVGYKKVQNRNIETQKDIRGRIEKNRREER